MCSSNIVFNFNLLSDNTPLMFIIFFYYTRKSTDTDKPDIFVKNIENLKFGFISIPGCSLLI